MYSVSVAKQPTENFSDRRGGGATYQDVVRPQGAWYRGLQGTHKAHYEGQHIRSAVAPHNHNGLRFDIARAKQPEFLQKELKSQLEIACRLRFSIALLSRNAVLHCLASVLARFLESTVPIANHRNSTISVRSAAALSPMGQATSPNGDAPDGRGALARKHSTTADTYAKCGGKERSNPELPSLFSWNRAEYGPEGTISRERERELTDAP